MRRNLPPTPRFTAAIAVLSLLGACSNYTGEWPQLGPTAQEARPAMDDGVEVAQVATQETSDIDAAAMQDLTARLSQVTVNYADAQARAQTQRRAVYKAVDSAGGVTGTNWSRAQLELSRLNQIDAELKELREDASGIAGDLAAMSARGMPADEQVGMTGTLINKITKTLQDIAETRARARTSLTT